MLFLNRAAIKNEAKIFISTDKKWWKMFLATVLIYILNNGINVVYNVYNRASEYGIQYYNDYYDDGSTVTVRISSSIIGIILIPFMTAICGYYLNHIRGFNPDWRSLYKEGFDHYGKYLTVGVARDIVVYLWTLLLIVPGVIKGLAYSQVEYIIHDNPNLSSSEARKISDIMTNGYKWDLFVLELSFILWDWLVVISLGIAGIYVLPYYHTTKAMYYENLKKHAIDTGLIAPEAFGLQMNVNPYDAPSNDFGEFNNGTPTYNGYQNTDYRFVPTQTHSEDTFNPDIVAEPAEQPEVENTVDSFSGSEESETLEEPEESEKPENEE